MTHAQSRKMCTKKAESAGADSVFLLHAHVTCTCHMHMHNMCMHMSHVCTCHMHMNNMCMHMDMDMHMCMCMYVISHMLPPNGLRRASVQGERRRLERGIEVRVRPARGGAGVHGRRLPPPGGPCTLRPAPWRCPGVVTSR